MVRTARAARTSKSGNGGMVAAERFKRMLVQRCTREYLLRRFGPLIPGGEVETNNAVCI